MKHDEQHDHGEEPVVGTLTLHVRLKRDAELVRDAAEKGISAADALWHSISGCRAWLEYRAQGLSVTYSTGPEGPARDRELGMVGDFSTSCGLEAANERAFFEAVARECEGEAKSPEEEGLGLVATLWREATGEDLVPDLPEEALDVRTVIVAMERLNRESSRQERSRTDERGFSYER
jgi:hypothetical protein